MTRRQLIPEHINETLEAAPVSVVLSWVNEHFPTEKIGFSTGFGSSGGVVLDHLVQVNKNIPVFYIDTGALFRETHALRDRIEKKYGIRFIRYRADLSWDEQEEKVGRRLWESNPDLCCDIRKVRPLREALSHYEVWITAIRRDQSPTRAHTRVIEWEPRFGVLKVNPLAAWTGDMVWRYINERNIPYNKLYDLGYGSIGCFYCTSALRAGESEREGRWRGLRKTECGLHYPTVNTWPHSLETPELTVNE